MSGPRLTLGRLPLAACLASCLSLFCALASCTAPTPGYCDDLHPCQTGTCGKNFLCALPTTDAADAAATGDLADSSDIRTDGDAGADAPADQPATGDGGNDLRDATADVDGPKSCDGGCAGDGGTPVCDTTRGVCVGCLNDNDCAGDAGAAHVCDTMAKKCVQCVLPRDCHNPNAPICDNQICRGCKVDFECMGIGPEVCMSHVGKHCATDDETVYVKKTSCSDTMPSSGSKTLPFCNSQPAIDSANGRPPPRDGGTGADAGPAPLKNLVVMRGTDPLTFWTFNANRTLTVVGKDGAVIHGGAFEGITLGAGTLYLRDLEVSGGDTAGINATGGELHLDRVVAAGNRGGIFLDNTSFAITNSVIAGGTQAMIPNSLIVWSGIFIGTIPAAGPASLFNDTIVGNATGAVVCGDTASTPSRARLAGLILWGNSLDFLGNCTVPASCCGLANGQPVDPMLDSTYHLISGSPCINKLTAGNLTSYDFEGDPRPLGGASDCGADEFRPTTP